MKYSHIKTQIINRLSIVFLGLIGIVYFLSCNKIAQTVPLPNAQPDFYFEDMDYVAPCEVLFENRTYYAQEFEWDFGDGRVYTNTDQLYLFEDAGTYSVALKAINPDGKAQSVIKEITILESDIVPEKHPYDGKWQVMKVLGDTKKIGLPNNTMVESSVLAGPDLGPFTPSGWNGPVVVRNSLFNANNIQSSEINYGDAVFAAFGFQNHGDQDISIPFKITVSVDGNYVTQWDYPSPFVAGAAQYFYDIYIGNLSPGFHTVNFVLDPLNSVAEADETNNTISYEFEVKDMIAFSGFEFNKNRYVLYFSDGIQEYGGMEYYGNEIFMENFGSGEVVSYFTDSMIYNFDGVTYKLNRIEPLEALDNKILKFTNGVWIHSQNVDTVMQDDEWFFTEGGTFISNQSGEIEHGNYQFISDSVFLVNGQTQMTIDELTITRLKVTDANQQTYLLNSINGVQN